MLIKPALNVGPTRIKATTVPGQTEHIGHLECMLPGALPPAPLGLPGGEEGAGRESARGLGGASGRETHGPGSTPPPATALSHGSGWERRGSARKWALQTPDASSHSRGLRCRCRSRGL